MNVEMLYCSGALLQIIPTSKCEEVTILVEHGAQGISVRLRQHTRKPRCLVPVNVIQLCTLGFGSGQPFSLSHLTVESYFSKELFVSRKCIGITGFVGYLPFYRISKQEEQFHLIYIALTSAGQFLRAVIFLSLPRFVSTPHYGVGFWIVFAQGLGHFDIMIFHQRHSPADVFCLDKLH